MGALTAKKVEVMIKNKLDKPGMAKELGMSVEELECEFKKLYHEDTLAKIYRRIKANEKLKKSHSSAPALSQVENTTLTLGEVATKSPTLAQVTSDVPTLAQAASDESTLVQDLTPTDDVETEVIALSYEVADNLSIEEVQASIDDKTTQLSSLERKHQLSASNRSAIKSRITAKKNELEKMLNRVSVIKHEVDALVSEFDSEEAKMKEFSLQIAQTRNAIDKLTERRSELETLLILVYSDGRIEINNELFPSKDIPTTWEDIYQGFYGNEVLDALTGFEQKNLAKFFALLRVLPSNRKQDICFENNDMQAAYEVLKGGILN